MIKVPSDPAQVVVNHASFRVRLATLSWAGHVPRRRRPGRGLGARPGQASGCSRGDAAARRPAAPRARGVERTRRARRGGRHQLLEAVRPSGLPPEGDGEDAGATQVLPASGWTRARPPSSARAARSLTPVGVGRRPAPARAYDEYGEDGYGPGPPSRRSPSPAPSAPGRRGTARAPLLRHAAARLLPGRRMNLGVVLLPLRVFLGLISIYAGMGKLSDPVYFDGGERGSMVTWLRSLHPWPMAEPLRDFALGHPVGAGLTIAFLQVVVGVLTVMGLWQRLAACVGALLSAALLVTVSWRTVPAYDAPDIIYLAAWSPLIIAGAPVYSMDSRPRATPGGGWARASACGTCGGGCCGAAR
ncbi:DoxX family protein [Streptomyces sp. M19]